MLTEEIKKLSNPEKWSLFNDLWDELCQDPDNIEISEEQKRILDERYQEFLKNPKEGSSWEEVKSKFLQSL